MATKAAKTKDVFKRFGSIKEFNNYLDAGTNHLISESSHTGSSDFTGTESYADATKLFLYGDKELQKRINELGVAKYRKVAMNKFAPKRQTFSCVQGFAPHVPNYIAGTPNSMINMRTMHIRQNVVTVFYNSAVSGWVDADDITKAVSKLCCALVKLEAQGIRVNLYAGTLGTSGKQNGSFAIKIKDSGQPFDTLKMVYPLAHPSFNRRHKFRFIEVTKEINSSWAHGYGSSQTNDEKTREFLCEHGLKVDRAFNYESLQCAAIDDIINMITNNKK